MQHPAFPLAHTRAAIWLDQVLWNESSDNISAYLEPLDWFSMLLGNHYWLRTYLMHTGQIWWSQELLYLPLLSLEPFRFHSRYFPALLLNNNPRLLKDTYPDGYSWGDINQKNPTIYGCCESYWTFRIQARLYYPSEVTYKPYEQGMVLFFHQNNFREKLCLVIPQFLLPDMCENKTLHLE